jgi:hypothetical protein
MFSALQAGGHAVTPSLPSFDVALNEPESISSLGKIFPSHSGAVFNERSIGGVEG